MAEKNNGSDQVTLLRRQAEEIARIKLVRPPEDTAALSPEENRRLLHELRVHQIELEIQNEELRRVQAELETARARYFDLYDVAPVGYCTVSEQSLILEANLTAAGLLGATRSELVKRPISRFILKEDQDIYYLHRKQLFETGAPQGCELRLRRADESHFWARLDATMAQEMDGTPVCRLAISDITVLTRGEDNLRRAKESLETTHRELLQSLVREQFLARTDGLTGLYNYRHFSEIAAHEFSAAARYRLPLTIFMFDVDGFKQINDTVGHKAGDKVLEQVALAITEQIRTVDVLARYGGDEFIILLPQTSAQQALPIAERIRQSVATLRLETDNGPLGITVSIGIAEAEHEPADESVEAVIQHADKAMYTAKAEGCNCTVIYSVQPQGSAV
jgi:diguanylate cyclase (GGDEF)-like protein/PAS domain S-box-containing protein